MWVWAFFTLGNIMLVGRLGASIYMLYALRHPSILPDEKSQFVNASNNGGRVVAGRPLGFTKLNPTLCFHELSGTFRVSDNVRY